MKRVIKFMVSMAAAAGLSWLFHEPSFKQAQTCVLFLPVSTPPNAIAYSTGMIEQKDFRIGGLLIGLLGPAIIILWVLLIT